jgi:hypothetical protein
MNRVIMLYADWKCCPPHYVTFYNFNGWYHKLSIMFRGQGTSWEGKLKGTRVPPGGGRVQHPSKNA